MKKRKLRKVFGWYTPSPKPLSIPGRRPSILSKALQLSNLKTKKGLNLKKTISLAAYKLYVKTKRKPKSIYWEVK
jgi:hypothetical protein